MAKFVMLPQHYNKADFAVNIDKILLVEISRSHPSSARVTLGRDCDIEVKLSLDEVVVLLNNAAKE